jgi:hypothetical protein
MKKAQAVFARGFVPTCAIAADMIAGGGRLLGTSELPAVDEMATIVRLGTDSPSHTSFGTIGTWIEANGYEIAGPCREVFLEPITGARRLEGASTGE